MPIIEGSVSRQQIPAVVGAVWYADSAKSGLGGGSWGDAFATVAAAVAAASAGDTIMIKGSFIEAVTIAVAKTGLKIIGAGTGPNQARWTAATDAVALTINAENVWIENIRFSPPAYAANRATSAITLGGANWTVIRKCRFQGKTGSQAAIYSPVCDSDNVTIEECDFYYMNTATYGAGIVGVETGGLSYSGWKIKNCNFSSCAIGININGRCCVITGCNIAEGGVNPAGALATLLALGIDLSGTSSGGNIVTRNMLGGTYSSTLYKVGASADEWAGNFNVITGGVTAANPA